MTKLASEQQIIEPQNDNNIYLFGPEKVRADPDESMTVINLTDGKPVNNLLKKSLEYFSITTFSNITG